MINPCLLSLALVSGSIATTIATLTNHESKELYNSLDNEDQRQMYYIVKSERMQIYLSAYAISLTLAMLYAFALNRRNKPINFCIVSSIIHGLALIIYNMYPKNYSLSSYLSSQEQLYKYEKLCNKMKNSYFIGLFVGVLLFMFSEPKCFLS